MNKIFAFSNMNKGEKSLILFLLLRAVFVSIIVVSAYSYQGAVFLNLFPSEFLPWLYSSVSIALVAFSLPFSFFQHKYGSKKTDIILLGVLTAGLLTVIAFPQLLLRSSPLFVISIWIKLLAVFSTISFWHYTTRVFYSRKAKVLLPVIAAGFSLGSAFAGKFINIFSTIWGTQIILYILVAFSFLNISALFPLKTDFQKQNKNFHDQETNLISRGFRLLATNRLAFYLTLFILFSIPVFLCTDFILKKAVRANYGKDGMAAFFGNYQFYINLGVFFLQTLFMSKIMKKFGVNKTTIITPLFLVLLFPLFLFFPSLTWALIFAVGASILRLTIYINSRNQLITPFSPPEKETASLFLRTVVAPVGTVATGFILFPLKSQDIQIIAILALLVSFVFFFLSFKAASAYEQELKKALKKKTLSPVFYGHSGLVPDKSLLNNLKDRVISSSFEESSFAVSLLAQYNELELHQVEAFFEARFPHIDPVLSKIRAVDLAEFLPDSAKKEFFTYVLKQNTDCRIVTRIVSILSELKAKWVDEIARSLYENSTNLNKKGNGLLLLLHKEEINEDQVLLELLTSLYDSEDHKNRILVAKISVYLSPKQSGIYLQKLLKDEKPEVVNATVALIGKFKKEKLYEEMMQLASQQRFRKTVVQAVKDADLELEFYKKHFSMIRLQKIMLRLLVDSDKSEVAEVVKSKLTLNRGYFTALILHEFDIRNIPVSKFIKDKSDFYKILYRNYALYVSTMVSCEEKKLLNQLKAESRFWLKAIFSWLRLVNPRKKKIFLRIEQSLQTKSEYQLNAARELLDEWPGGKLKWLADGIEGNVLNMRKNLKLAGVSLPEVQDFTDRINAFDDKYIKQFILEDIKKNNRNSLFQKSLIFRNSGFFENLPTEMVMELARMGEIVEMQPDTILFEEGDKGNNLFLVNRGELEILIRGKRVNFCGPDSVIGEIALLDQGRRTATVRSVSFATLTRISSKLFNYMLDEYPEVARQVSITLAGHIRSLATHMDDSNLVPISQGTV